MLSMALQLSQRTRYYSPLLVMRQFHGLQSNFSFESISDRNNVGWSWHGSVYGERFRQSRLPLWYGNLYKMTTRLFVSYSVTVVIVSILKKRTIYTLSAAINTWWIDGMLLGDYKPSKYYLIYTSGSVHWRYHIIKWLYQNSRSNKLQLISDLSDVDN